MYPWSRRALSAFAICLAAFAFSIVGSDSVAVAVVQPDGRIVPQLNVNEDSGHSPGTALQKLFVNRGETVGGVTLDFQKDALTSQTTFSPTCGNLTGTLVLHGSVCNLDFGWYNVNASSSTPPPDNQIYTLVPSTANGQFCPRSGASTSCPATLSQFNIGSILTDARYTGGPIGFAIKGDPATGALCKQTHYSESRLNLLCDNGSGRCPICTTANTPGCSSAGGTNPAGRWIMALTYQSLIAQNSYYLAFEDLPSGTTTYTAPGTNGSNDGDFNDDVYFITGVTCQGGGTSCTTGKPGICAAGINQCSKGNLVCTQLEQPTTEVCDGLDNNCDGQVDNPDADPSKPPCAGNKVCDRGTCVDFCVEQSCPIGQFCGSNRTCSDEACRNVSCGAGQRCVGGTCVGPCDGVVCPAGQQCRVGRCVDPCQGVACDTGFVCQDGVCKSNCSCTACTAAGTTCTQDGRCTPNKCVNKACAAGTVCNPNTGNCDDACAGAKCPNGIACEVGQCVDKCANVQCSPGKKCSGGTCVDTGCAISACPQGFVCDGSNNTCVDACHVLTCQPGYFCQLGQCIDPNPGTGGAGGSGGMGGSAGAGGAGGAAGGAAGTPAGGNGGSLGGRAGSSSTGGVVASGGGGMGGISSGPGGQAGGGNPAGGVGQTGGAGTGGQAGQIAAGGNGSGGNASGGTSGGAGSGLGGNGQGGVVAVGGQAGSGTGGTTPLTDAGIDALDAAAGTGGRIADASADVRKDGASSDGATGGATEVGGGSGCGCDVGSGNVPVGSLGAFMLVIGGVLSRRGRGSRRGR